MKSISNPGLSGNIASSPITFTGDFPAKPIKSKYRATCLGMTSIAGGSGIFSNFSSDNIGIGEIPSGNF